MVFNRDYAPVSSRDELIAELSDMECEETAGFAESFIERIEALGLRIVPADPTGEMVKEFDWLTKEAGCGVTESLIAAIGKSPFTPGWSPFDHDRLQSKEGE